MQNRVLPASFARAAASVEYRHTRHPSHLRYLLKTG
jgi:hypothetical protein